MYIGQNITWYVYKKIKNKKLINHISEIIHIRPMNTDTQTGNSPPCKQMPGWTDTINLPILSRVSRETGNKQCFFLP